MTYDNKDVASRLRGLREILELSVDELAAATGVTADEYAAYERGEQEFHVSFLYKCAQAMSIDLVELLTGEVPRLKTYTLVRKGGGLPIERRESLNYRHLAYLFAGKRMEPLIVMAPFSEHEQEAPIPLSSHAGQEFDYILSGSLRFMIDGHTEELHEGDAVYYDSANPHGMIAIDGRPCEFLAILVRK